MRDESAACFSTRSRSMSAIITTPVQNLRIIFSVLHYRSRRRQRKVEECVAADKSRSTALRDFSVTLERVRKRRRQLASPWDGKSFVQISTNTLTTVDVHREALPRIFQVK